MALSTRKKNQIIAEWKAGKFSSFYAVSKHYKISQPSVKKILVNITQSNADIVEAGVIYETAKKVSKNIVEINAIENEVISRVNTMEIDNELMKENRVIAKILQETITASKGEIDLSNIKAVSGTLKDIEAIANPQASKTDVTVNTQVNNTSNLSIEDFYET